MKDLIFQLYKAIREYNITESLFSFCCFIAGIFAVVMMFSGVINQNLHLAVCGMLTCLGIIVVKVVVDEYL